MTAFTSTAAYYEALADKEGRLDREGPFLLDVFRRAPGPRVLDMACGVGLHAAFMAAHGAEVTALDLSQDMVAHASRRRPHPKIFYTVGDMRRLVGEPWDLALCLGNSFALVHTPDEVEDVFRATFAALNPRGLFVAQVVNGAALAYRKPRHRVERHRIGAEEVVAVKSLVPRDERTLLSLSFFSCSEGQYSSVSETAVLLRLERDTVLGAAQRAGFDALEVWGGYDRSPFDADHSPDLVCVFGKPSVPGP